MRKKIFLIKNSLLSRNLKQGNQVSYIEKGSSMNPFIISGSQLFIRPVKNVACLKVGDIIIFSNKKALINHRIIEIKTERKSGKKKKSNNTVFITRGDAKQRNDFPVSASQVLGKVVSLKRKDKLINLETPKMRIINYLLAVKSKNLLVFLKTTHSRKHSFISYLRIILKKIIFKFIYQY